MNGIISKELRKYQDQDDLNFTIDCEDDITELRVTLTAPEGTPYEDGLFFLKMHIPAQYPASAPTIEFETKIYHPNIDENGKICMQSLKEMWNPTFDLKKAIDFVYELLKNPDWTNPLRSDILRDTYEAKAKEYTKTWAK